MVALFLAGGTVGDVDAATIRIPAFDARVEVVVGVGDPAVVLLLEFIEGRSRVRVPAAPELLDEGVPFGVGAQVVEDLLLFVRDDVDDVLSQPLLEVVLLLLHPLALIALLGLLRPFPLLFGLPVLGSQHGSGSDRHEQKGDTESLEE